MFTGSVNHQLLGRIAKGIPLQRHGLESRLLGCRVKSLIVIETRGA
jgi:hypothetical protein